MKKKNVVVVYVEQHGHAVRVLRLDEKQWVDSKWIDFEGHQSR